MTRTLLASLLFLSAAGAVQAQTPAMPPPGTTANVEVDPIRCWWRTSAGAVRIGEQFDLSLTCAVLENDAVQVVPGRVAPRRVGRRDGAVRSAWADHPRGPALGHSGAFSSISTRCASSIPDAIGKDVRIPDMVMHYKVNSRVAANTVAAGARPASTSCRRSRSASPRWCRRDAGDIRDAAGESFAHRRLARSARRDVLEIVAIACVALGALMMIFVLVRLVAPGRAADAGRRTHAVRRAASSAPPFANWRRSQREREQQGGPRRWPGGRWRRSRIAAACAIGRPVSQRLAGPPVVDGAGRVIDAGTIPRQSACAVEPGDRPAICAHDARQSPIRGRQPMLEELRDCADDVLAGAVRARPPSSIRSALDTALSSRQQRGWPREGRARLDPRPLLQRLTRAAPPVESRA